MSTSILELITSNDGDLSKDAIKRIAEDLPRALLIDDFYKIPIPAIFEILSQTTHVFSISDAEEFLEKLMEAHGGLSMFDISHLQLALLSKKTPSEDDEISDLSILFDFEEKIKEEDVLVQALRRAIEVGNVENVYDLIKSDKSLVNAKFFTGDSPIQYAASMGSYNIVYILARLGADVNSRDKRNRTPLHDAANSGYIKTVGILLCRGAKINLQDSNGWTALHYAAEEGHADVCKFLMEHAADPLIKSNDDFLPEDCAANDECVAALKPNHYCEIFSALYREDESTVLSLIETYPNLIRARNSVGTAPLNVVGRMGNARILSILLEHGAEIDSVDSNGWTVLHEACDFGKLEIVKLLVEKGADINKQDDAGRTPLFWASLRGHREIVEFLLRRGADRNIPNKKNEKPEQVTKDFVTFALLNKL